MKKINIILGDEDDHMIFKEAINEIKLDSVLNMIEGGIELMEHLLDPKSELPDIVFLDLNMPCKDGVQCLSEIRASEKLKNLAVIIYSTSSSPKDIEECFFGGANAYIKKQNNFKNLKTILHKVLSLNLNCYGSKPNMENFEIKI